MASTLSKVGSQNSIKSLKEIVRNSKKSETILSSLNAIDRINGENELEFFLETFASKKDSFVKSNLVKLISKTGNGDQSELMTKRLKSILSRKRQTNWVYLNPEFKLQMQLWLMNLFYLQARRILIFF